MENLFSLKHPHDGHEFNASVQYQETRSLFQRKPALRKLYLEVYQKFARCLLQCPSDGIVLELGSGAGFLKEVIPEVMTSDLLDYPGLDLKVDATKMPFPDSSIRAIFMVNVFHHLPDAAAFLKEADRCLKPGGRIFIVDQHLGVISYPVLKYLHHEPMDRDSKDWTFQTTGPLSGANGALAWMVFKRDLKRFKREFPGLKIVRNEPHTPLRYWWVGGLKSWSLLPGFAFKFATVLDQLLSRITSRLCSFIDIELVKD